MKKNLRAIITYSVLGLLCISALVGYLISENSRPAVSLAANASGTTAPASAPPSTVKATLLVSSAASLSASAAATPEATLEPTPTPIETRAPMTPEEHLQAVMKTASEMPSDHLVAIARGTDYDAVTKEVIEKAGGLKGIVKPGDTVVIKPNLIKGQPEGSPICTDWRAVKAVADVVRECGAARIIVAEGSGYAGDNFKKAGYYQIEGVEFVDINKIKKNTKECYYLKPERSLTGHKIYIPKIYMDADVVIGVAKLKTHDNPDAIVSLGLKLSFGVVPYPRGILHNYGVKKSVVDLNRIRRPDFMVIEGIVGGEGKGAIANTPVDSQIMFAGRDIVALDTVALTFMGFTLDQCPHVKLASVEGLGISDLSQITVVGADLDSIKMKFKKPR
jgi:uncharacterized protein (DUF362 family)